MKEQAQQNDIKRLYRSKTQRQWLGVCGGIAEYLNADPTPIRLLWVVCTIFTGFVPGLLAYMIAALVMPSDPSA